MIDSKYTKPSDGIPASDIASGVIPVEKGTGVNSIVPSTVFGELTSTLHLATISGDANATSYTVSMQGPPISLILSVGSKVSLDGQTNIAKVLSISGSTIVVDKTLSDTAISNRDFYTTRPIDASLCDASGKYSIAMGYRTVAEGQASMANGYNDSSANPNYTIIKASGKGSHAEGYAYSTGKISADGTGSYAKGYAGSGDIKASGEGSHAEGYASGNLSIIASGSGSHAEGYVNRQQYSFGNITASGPGAHAEGVGTTAQNFGEHAEGCCNKSNKASSTYGNAGNTQHSVGIGTSDNDRKNAFEIMQNGNVYVKGIGGYDGTNAGAAFCKPLNLIIKNYDITLQNIQTISTGEVGFIKLDDLSSNLNFTPLETIRTNMDQYSSLNSFIYTSREQALMVAGLVDSPLSEMNYMSFANALQGTDYGPSNDDINNADIYIFANSYLPCEKLDTGAWYFDGYIVAFYKGPDDNYYLAFHKAAY